MAKQSGKKHALITGVTGQDGAYLAKLLLDKGYEVFGIYRRTSTPNFWRLQHLDIFHQIRLIPSDLTDTSSLIEAVNISEPQEVYHLAAQSFVAASFEQPEATGSITGLGVTRILEVIRAINPKIKFYQASTSELYGKGNHKAQTEETPFRPASPYSAAKLYGYWVTRIYREGYGIFACNGILFNHESPIRGMEFVTRKISNEVAKIALGLSKGLSLGNMEAKRDWGYAPEYVEAMWRMLQQEKPDDYIIATGEAHSVKEFVEKAFKVAGLD
jgi:GDPmannose 4,6-dehydratase